jgi:hypothetical protein
MPQDNLIYAGPMIRAIAWGRMFAVLPHRCIRSRKIIWFKYARSGYLITGLGQGDSGWVWMTEQEYLIHCLKAGNE